MKKESIAPFIITYLLLLAINILSQVWEMPAWILPVSKTFLMPVLMVGLFLSISHPIHSLARIVLFALFFSWAGDVFLIFQGKNGNFFLAGLVAFLSAHIAYISFFGKIKQPAPGWWKQHIWVVIMVIAYGVLLVGLLWKTLGPMKVPVLFYTSFIIAMLLLCLRAQPGLPKTIWIWMGMGAYLFVMSDSILAINKFMQPFEFAGPLIMLTYGLAQLFIVIGSIRLFQSKFGANAIPAV